MMSSKFTEQQKSDALAHAEKALASRLEYAGRIRRNSFEEWGNDKCVSRAQDTIRAMKSGNASDAQYRYWLSH